MLGRMAVYILSAESPKELECDRLVRHGCLAAKHERSAATTHEPANQITSIFMVVAGIFLLFLLGALPARSIGDTASMETVNVIICHYQFLCLEPSHCASTGT